MGTRPLLRERAEELERTGLSMWATLATETKGRDRYEEPDPVRTTFQVDRDRILSSVAFGALSGKSALFPASEDASRLHETLETANCGRLWARSLRLNEDLTEAIALGQALGATAFADAGVEALSSLLDHPYDPAEQAVRIVEQIEDARAGLNLTWETRDGILAQGGDLSQPATLEGQLVWLARRCGRLGFRYHVGARRELVDAEALPPRATEVLGSAPTAWRARVGEALVADSGDRPRIQVEAGVLDALDELDAAVSAAFDGSAQAPGERSRAVHCVASVAVYHLERADGRDTVRVVDRIAGCTDRRLVGEYRRLFEPSAG